MGEISANPHTLLACLLQKLSLMRSEGVHRWLLTGQRGLAWRRRVSASALLQLCPIDACCLHPAMQRAKLTHRIIDVGRPACISQVCIHRAAEDQSMHTVRLRTCMHAGMCIRGCALDADICGLHGWHIDGGHVQHTYAAVYHHFSNASNLLLKSSTSCASLVTYPRLLADRTQ